MPNYVKNICELLCAEDLADCILSTIEDAFHEQSNSTSRLYPKLIEADRSSELFNPLDQKRIATLIKENSFLRDASCFRMINSKDKKQFGFSTRYIPDATFVPEFSRYCRILVDYEYQEEMGHFRGRECWLRGEPLYATYIETTQEGEVISQSFYPEEKV